MPHENPEVPWNWDAVISSAHDEAEYHFYVGSRCNAEGNYDQAIFNLDKAIWADTLNACYLCQAYFERGYSRYKNGDLKDAWQDYLKSLQTEPDSHFQDLRFNWYSRDNGQENIKEFTELTEAFPDSAVLYYLRGLVALDLKDYDSAVADFTEAIKLEPESGNIEDFHALRGYAFYLKGLYSEAIDEFTHLIEKEIIPIPEIFYYRALALEKEDKTADAIEDIKKCLHADPNQEVFLKKFNALKNTKKR